MGQTQEQLTGFPQPGGPDAMGGFGNGANIIPGQTVPGWWTGRTRRWSGRQVDLEAAGVAHAAGLGAVEAGRRRGSADRKGIDALWGAQRVMRQRINRTHYSFYDTYGNAALNARPFELNGGRDAENFQLDRVRRIQHGRAVEDSARIRWNR